MLVSSSYFYDTSCHSNRLNWYCRRSTTHSMSKMSSIIPPPTLESSDSIYHTRMIVSELYIDYSRAHTRNWCRYEGSRSCPISELTNIVGSPTRYCTTRTDRTGTKSTCRNISNTTRKSTHLCRYQSISRSTISDLTVTICSPTQNRSRICQSTGMGSM